MQCNICVLSLAFGFPEDFVGKHSCCSEARIWGVRTAFGAYIELWMPVMHPQACKFLNALQNALPTMTVDQLQQRLDLLQSVQLFHASHGLGNRTC